MVGITEDMDSELFGLSRAQRLFVYGFALGAITSVVGAWLLLKLLGD